MVKYEQWNVNQNNIFHEMYELSPNGVIGVLGVDELNMFYSIKHGGKEMVPSLCNKSTGMVAKMLHNMFMDKWNALHDIYMNGLEVGFESSTTSNRNNIQTNEKNLTSSKTEKVSAFNDDELTDVSGENDSLDESGKRMNDDFSTSTTKNIKSIDIQRSLLENSNISTVIIDDISKVISLSIY